MGEIVAKDENDKGLISKINRQLSYTQQQKKKKKEKEK